MGVDFALSAAGCSPQPQTGGRFDSLCCLARTGGIDPARLADAAAYRHAVVETIRRTDKANGSKGLPKRQAIERIFGWITRWRRLLCDDEQRPDVFEAMTRVALGSLLLRRIARPWVFSDRLQARRSRLVCQFVHSLSPRLVHSVSPRSHRNRISHTWLDLV